ncbi:aminoglycoside phosphotransferase/kinase family protein [Halomonas sp. WWR20]
MSPVALDWPDSANWLWKTRGVAPQLLKLARTSPPGDPFWKGIHDLFGFDRWEHPESLTRLGGALPADLAMPPLPLTFLGRLQGAPIWSLPWRQACKPSMTATFAELLGEQLGRLHREHVSGWGHPLTATHALSEWPQRARAFIERHPRYGEIDMPLTMAVPTRAVWSLPDLRPDQFLCGATGWHWCDWEALVWAPWELDMCLMEMQCQTRAQYAAFLACYTRHQPLPELQAFRTGMRAVLWAMNVFGDVDWQWVKTRPVW